MKTTKSALSLSPFLQQCQSRVDQQLTELFAHAHAPSARLCDAMQYACLAGGKRLRPLLVYATGQVFAVAPEVLDKAALAVELMHTYSLIHDDLPAMDDDDLRRGQSTCHKAFDEATAILAGDALQTLAFSQLAQPHAGLSAEQRLHMVQVLAHASGIAGMAGGQALDLAATGEAQTVQGLRELHQLKTGALMVASVRMAMAATTVAPAQQQAIVQFAQHMGLAFQVQDDLLDVTGDSQIMGKSTGADAALAKVTFPAVLGIEASRALLDTLYEQALGALVELRQDTSDLAALAELFIRRSY